MAAKRAPLLSKTTAIEAVADESVRMMRKLVSAVAALKIEVANLKCKECKKCQTHP